MTYVLIADLTETVRGRTIAAPGELPQAEMRADLLQRLTAAKAAL
jgi:hypothetical protein